MQEKRLRLNDPNYFVYAFPLSGGDLRDDRHLEYHISIKYPLLGSHDTQRLLFIYNGLYDFYILDGTRYRSAPSFPAAKTPE